MNVDSASDSGGREFFFPTLTKCFLIGINTFWEDFRSNVVGLLPYNTEWTSARKLIKWIESNYSSYLKETMWSGLTCIYESSCRHCCAYFGLLWVQLHYWGSDMVLSWTWSELQLALCGVDLIALSQQIWHQFRLNVTTFGPHPECYLAFVQYNF